VTRLCLGLLLPIKRQNRSRCSIFSDLPGELSAEGVSLNTLVTVFVATGLERPAASRRSAPRRKAVG